MNVPKTSDYKLIGAARALANDALTTGAIDLNVLPAVLYEIADRLAELTQPQPIETAPRDGTVIKLYIGKPFFVTGFWHTELGEGRAGWVYVCEDGQEFYELITPPTQWLRCVEIDLSALEGKGDGA